MVTARTGALISPYTACGKPVYNGRALWTGCGRQRAYLRLTRLRAIVEDTALIAVPDAFTRDVIESKLRPAITEVLSRRLGRPIQVAVTVRAPEEAPPATYLTGYAAPVPTQHEPPPVPTSAPAVPAARLAEPTLFDAALLDAQPRYQSDR